MLSKTLFASLLIASATADGATSYDYTDLGENWKGMTDAYPDCAAGREQSPIDLTTATFSSESNGGEMKFEGHGYKDYTQNKELLKLEHTLKMLVPDGTLRETFPDGTTDFFQAAQLHFHTPSEHSVDGKLLPMEMHLVHVHPEDADTKFSVLGFLFEVGDTQNEFLEHLGFHNATDPVNTLTEVDLASFLGSVDMSAYWHYDGSFTTPPCTEGVKWWVIKEVQTITQEELDAFRSYTWGDAEYDAGKGNNRQVQPLNDRTLYFKDTSMSGASALTAFGAAALSMLALF